MRIKFFKQGSYDTPIMDDDFENAINEFCSHHDVVNMAVCQRTQKPLELLTVAVVYRD